MGRLRKINDPASDRNQLLGRYPNHMGGLASPFVALEKKKL
jgi:hypothetical protein